MAGRALQRKLEQAKHLKATRTRKMATSPSSPSSAAGAHLTSPKPSPSRPPSEKAEVKMVEMNESFRQLQAYEGLVLGETKPPMFSSDSVIGHRVTTREDSFTAEPIFPLGIAL